MQLTHLFTAKFADGSIIIQDENDTSMLDPEKRSTFYDVMEKQKTTPLVSFLLRGSGHTYLVDLKDGHFELDGTRFMLHTHDAKQFRIIFFRSHTHTFSQAPNQMPVETSHLMTYNIGWQCELSGKDHQRVMTIK